MKRKLLIGAGVVGAATLLFANPAAAETLEELQAEVALERQILDNLWVFIAGTLVFFMQAGFALLEGGLTRAKNVSNIMMKNLMDLSAGVLSFALVGWGIAYSGDELLGGWFGFGVGIPGIDSFEMDGELWTATDFFFQAAFAATAATIVAGSMAERTKFRSYFIYSVVVTGVIYPIVVRWTWGGGWLEQLDTPFSDFAGSTIVHGTGGFVALAGAMVVGPRIGKYDKDGNARAIPGHSIPLALLGAMILFIGWMGFNPGSELAANEAVMVLGVRTLLSALGGALAIVVINWAIDNKPDVSMAINGLLGGLVAITAPVGTVETWITPFIGAVGGIIVYFGVRGLDKAGVDDPVGAISVHGFAGVWGTISIGLFAKFDDGFIDPEMGLFYGGGVDQLVTQGTMVVVHFVFVFAAAYLLFSAIKATVGLRVSEEVEMSGLDVAEHGHSGYSPDVVTSGATSSSSSTTESI